MRRSTRDAHVAEYFEAPVLHLRRLAYGSHGDWRTAEDLAHASFVAL